MAGLGGGLNTVAMFPSATTNINTCFMVNAIYFIDRLWTLVCHFEFYFIVCLHLYNACMFRLSERLPAGSI